MAEQTNLPSIPPPNENNLVAFARAVKEALEVRLGRRGQGLDAMVTFRDLDKVQMVQGDGRGGVVGLRPPAAIGAVGGGYDPTLDTTPPSVPTGVKASGAVRNIILEWDGPPSTYRNHAYAEIWRSSTNNLNDAAQIGQSGSTMYVDNVGEGQTRYYWVRFVSQANVTGPWSAAGNAGAQGATSLDVSYTLGLLTSNGFGDPASQSPFVHLDAPVTINGVEAPAGTYLHQAWVANGTITRLKVADAAIDDAKVANLSAAKLTAGDGTIGGILKSANYDSGVSGWAVHPSGWAEFANATVRGTVYADTGWFKGQIIGGAATTYTSGMGMWTGVDAGMWKFRLGSSGTYLRWDGASLTLRGTLTIEDGDGNVLLSAGSGVPWDRISGAGKPADGATVGMLNTEQSDGYTSTNGWKMSKDGTFSANGGGNQIIVGLNSAKINFNKPGGGTSFAVDQQGNALFAGQLLAATGTFAGTLQAGVLDPSAFAGIVYTYATAGTHTVTVPAKPSSWANINMRVTLVGGGGGGGGARTPWDSTSVSGEEVTHYTRSGGGGGGGAGALTTYVIANVTPGASYSLTVGEGGAGGSATYTYGYNGGNGGATSMAGVGSSAGGTGGAGTGDSTQNAAGGSLGGLSGTGYTRVLLGINYLSGSLTDGRGGDGGSTSFGAGGAGGAGANGGAGTAGGGGGGGGSDYGPPTWAARSGGAGGDGYAIVEFFDKDSVVTNTRYSNLIAWLDSRGLGAVPSNAR